MPRTKIKKTKVTAGQRDISSFFSPQKQKDSTCSTKFTTLIKTEAQVNHGETSPSRVLSLSPSTRSILGVIENLAPSSPELLLSVPETPESQIRPTSSSSPRDPGKSGQLSPLCQTPRSRRLNLRRVMTKEGRSGSPKRLLSSPEESHNAKRPRSTSTHALKPVTSDSPTMNALKVTRPATAPLNKPCFPSAHIKSNGQSERSEGQGLGLSFSGANQAVFSDSRKEVTSLKAVSVTEDSPQSLGEPRRCQEERAQDEEEPVFTVMAEQTHTHSSLDADKHTKADTHSLDTHMHKPNTNTATVASQISVEEGEVSVDGEEATAPAVTSVDQDRVAGTSLAQDGAGGITSCACPIEDELEDHWFEEQMDPGLVKEQKHTDTPRKVPDHVILCGGLNNRYWVLDVEEGPAHKVLTISCSKTLHPTETCLLKDGWETSPVSSGDVVHLEGRCDGGSWLVDREHGFLVLLPDRLVSGTSISSSIRCMRCAVLGDMFKSFDGGSKQMLNGTMVHEVFQKAAMAKDFSMETLSNLADKVLFSPQHLGLMYSLGVSQEEMKQELYDYLPSLKQWADEYLTSSKPKTISLKAPRSGGAPSSCKDSLDTIVTVTELVDIEENMWSPRFGLKGKIDVTAQVRIHRTRNANRSAPQERIMPLELKTGKETNAIEHRSQVILYTLMSMERHTDAEAGFLLYLKTGNLHPVVAGHMDRRELLKLRNTLVHHLGNPVEKWEGKSRLSRLPDILTNRHCCQYCPQRRNCALYERVMESSSSDNVSQDSVHDFLIQETGHLTPPHLNYFSHWLLLCCLESITMENKNSRKHVWLKTAEEREKSGGCVGNLQLIGPVIVQSEAVFLHQFQRRGVAFQEEASSGLADGDRVVVSSQDGHLVGLATGYLCDVNRSLISCILDRDLSKFSGLLFRLDNDEGVVGLSTHLTNLSRLMENCENSDRLRELVVDLRPPQFISNLSSVLPRDAKDTVANILKGLNKPQKQAMKKVLLSKDYTLIVGMPGTGKTTTICTLVRILHACGFSVLLTSYTHSAVDNILLKLKRFRVGFLRLGQAQKVHPDILPYTEESGRKKECHTLSELEQLYNKELVVATTCMGTKHPIFSRRRFDFCIIDEASQISQPVCLGPLFYAKRFVLVGDHQQLPPIVQNQEARSLGMDESLFKRLEHHSEAVVQLNVQYRMNRQIMSLSNSLMYGGRLECGSERTALALLSLPFLLSVQSELSSHFETCPERDLAWIQAALLPSNPVCFLDSSLVPALESVEQGGVSNHTEAALIHMLLTFLIKAGCRSSDIGVIAPYRRQLKIISALLQSPVFSGVEVNTVDRYQGRDKSVIVLSFVRSTTEEGNLGELLKDWRRLNVAVTRAKHKLLMVGSGSTLRRYAPLEKLLSHLQQENMIIQLPPAAHKALPSMHL